MKTPRIISILSKISLILIMFLILMTGCNKNINEVNSTKQKSNNGSINTESNEKSNDNISTKKDIYEKNDSKEEIEDISSKEEESDIYKRRNKNNFLICIDPGHGENSYEVMENIAPNSSEQKPGFAYGTKGVATGILERDLNLEVSKKLNEVLKAEGYRTAMTREVKESDMTNIGRAEFGNELNADLVIRIHANGSESQATRGAMVLVPSGKYISDQEVLDSSRVAGQHVLDAYINVTGANSLGLIERDDMTGFNWSKVPVILMEMGFMTNPEEDLLMSTPEYQEKMVQGMVDGINNYHFLLTK